MNTLPDFVCWNFLCWNTLPDFCLLDISGSLSCSKLFEKKTMHEESIWSHVQKCNSFALTTLEQQISKSKWIVRLNSLSYRSFSPFQKLRNNSSWNPLMTQTFNEKMAFFFGGCKPQNREHSQVSRYYWSICLPRAFGGGWLHCGMHHFKNPPKKEHRTLLRVQKK